MSQSLEDQTKLKVSRSLARTGASLEDTPSVVPRNHATVDALDRSFPGDSRFQLVVVRRSNGSPAPRIDYSSRPSPWSMVGAGGWATCGWTAASRIGRHRARSARGSQAEVGSSCPASSRIAARVRSRSTRFEAVALPVARKPAVIACDFDSFGDAAPSVEAAAGGWWRAEGSPEFAARIESSGCDAFGSGVVECVGEVVDGGGELRSLIGGVADGGGPVVDGSLFAFDPLLG